MGRRARIRAGCLVPAKTLPNSAHGAWGALEARPYCTMPRDDRRAFDRPNPFSLAQIASGKAEARPLAFH